MSFDISQLEIDSQDARCIHYKNAIIEWSGPLDKFYCMILYSLKGFSAEYLGNPVDCTDFKQAVALLKMVGKTAKFLHVNTSRYTSSDGGLIDINPEYINPEITEREFWKVFDEL